MMRNKGRGRRGGLGGRDVRFYLFNISIGVYFFSSLFADSSLVENSEGS